MTFRETAKEKLAVVEEGFKKRQAVIEGEIKQYFADATQAESSTAQALLALEQLKARVNVHKDREERKEQRMRLDRAREAQAKVAAAESDDQQAGGNAIEDKNVCIPDEATGKTCDDTKDGDETSSTPEFEEVAAGELVEAEEEETKGASEAVESAISVEDEVTESFRVTSQVELADGTRVSLAEYLRLERHAKSTKKL